ncbi:uncharacterized protein Z519_00927 [Cladophialophora bantiana CBS 173.52]|uniref:GIY-YIG domain-containing protein n=1 Tax=Cladophialophora bantiana (strain ATCC 10958 / CBS 173.52 / CDC B-1940 / NIH 8579) TaxID=1442370 RepID=A0A0D2IR90_CLAB1|nr:uncharacterized protein Z519_00927 [Cladophialophora bantiana CBS 173.52]KIW99264.1 hypothetical protein Z519_00927 [Cladophialophora bantiana CBS 173.52]
MDIKPIPAFYCCYLLRSTVRHSSLYIGSSPDPARRLAQHNGRVKGGAIRTSRASLRPWEMACIVAGFPSNVAALQFEWAWQNSHLTRHISPEQRISFATIRTKTSRTGKTTNRPGRPRASLIDRLSNLHLLLRAPYFSKWPLEVRFFSEDAYRSWSTWCGRVDTQIRPEIQVHFDPPGPGTQQLEEEEFTSAQPQPIQRRKKKADSIGRGGVDGVDPTYTRLQGVFEKSQFLLDEGDNQQCSVCAEIIDLRKSLFVICHTHNCQAISHIRCLADVSRNKTQSASSIVPGSATCPKCRQEHAWLALMQQVSLRNRGSKEVKKLLGKKSKGTATGAAEILETESEEEDSPSEREEETLTPRHVVDDETEMSFNDDDEDTLSVASADSIASMASNTSSRPVVNPDASIEEPDRLQIVIEDSEDEG